MDLEEEDEDELEDFIFDDDNDEEYNDKDIKNKNKEKRTPIKKSSTSINPVSSIRQKLAQSSIISIDSQSADNSSTLLKFSRGQTTVEYSQTNTESKPAKSTPTKSFEKENEERYSWLVDIRDAQGRPESDPDYDPRTLYIPKSAWAKFTAFEKQYWEIKSKWWNSVVFFKKGKFYELYERDADIGHQDFDLKLAGGGRANMRLVGVPEMSLDYWEDQFLRRGHKVVRVDQVETALAKEMRDNSKGGKKEEKIIRREMACVLTAGTLTDEALLVDDLSTYCMSIKQDSCKFAISLVDCSTGSFQVTEFDDDVDYSKFETIITQTRPRELVLERGNISSRAKRIVKNNTSVDAIWNILEPIAEFWDSETTHEELARGGYFKSEDLDDLSNYPDQLRSMIESRPFLLSCFGGLLYYLRTLKLDKDLISLSNFSDYQSYNREDNAKLPMILDGQSLQNLEVFVNNEGGTDGTLFKLINRCITPFGKRLLKSWIMSPLMDSKQINDRLDSVDYMNCHREFKDYIEEKLVTLPDLERNLSRIHSGHLKIKDFVRVIEGFQTIYEIILKCNDSLEDATSLLESLFESMPHLEDCLPMWSSAFDMNRAKTEGIFLPERGILPQFDESSDRINHLESELNKLLKKYQKEFRSLEICYRDSGKEIYLIEVPNKIKSIPKTWQQMASTSKVKRYWSPEVRSLVRELMEARELHKIESDKVKVRFYGQFDQFYNHWKGAIKVIANIDCLISLSKTSESLGFPNCRPKFTATNKSMLNFKELRHPCFMGSNFIPNDIALGGDRANISLLTGANAAGKSTVLRMTCLAVIMAQIGCYVPCEEAELTPVDRIMTRLGAYDSIFAGKSTFFVELSETKKMLSEATDRSLLVLDELGRGGSSSDGFAIAEAVLHHIATHIGSLGFFATHYGTLINSFDKHPQITPQRMAIMVTDMNVTFLYKLEPGTSPGSFGTNVALMCGVDEAIVKRAEAAAQNFEHTSRMKKLLEVNKDDSLLPIGLASDFSWLLASDGTNIEKSLECIILSLKNL